MKAVIIALLVLIAVASTSEQSVRVIGRLMCRGHPEQFAEVKLIDTTGFNRELNKNQFTDPSGYFELSGSVDRWATMDPWIYIWHRCHDKPYENNDPCWRHMSIQVPKIWVQDGILPDKTWDLGEFPLDLAKGQSEYCF